LNQKKTTRTQLIVPETNHLNGYSSITSVSCVHHCTQATLHSSVYTCRHFLLCYCR